MPTGSRPLPRSGRNVTYCTIGVRRSVTEMQAPARVGPFFAIATHPDLGRCCGLRHSLDRFPVSLECKCGRGAFKRLDYGELGVERLLLLGISCLDFGSTNLDRLFRVLDIVRGDVPHGVIAEWSVLSSHSATNPLKES